MQISRWLAALLFCLLAATAVLAEDNGAADRTIVVGGDRNYPPYEFLDADGQPAGFNVELTRAIAEVMGMDLEIRLGPWGEMRQGLASGKIDILQGMAWTRERTREVDFSTPHAKVHQSIWIRKGSTVRSLQDLAGHEVIVMRGSVMHDYILQRPKLKVRLRLVATLEDALRSLSAGVADAALVAKLPGEYLIQKDGLDNITPIAKPLVAQDYGYAVKKGNVDLLARFNEGLVLLNKSGRYRPIYEKWLGVLPRPGIALSQIVQIGAIVLLPLLLILGLTVFWSRTLKRQVALRTLDLEQEVAKNRQAFRELEVRQQQLIQADKLSSLGILTSGVAHEINNPNGLILLNLPLLKKSWDDALRLLQEHYRLQGDFKLGWLNFSRMRHEIPQMLEEMQQGASRIKRIVEDLKDFTRQDSAELDEAVDLSQVAETALRLVDNSLKQATDHFRAELTPDMPRFRGNAQRIEQVLVNLLLNACHALKSRDEAIELRTGVQADGWLFLEVRDQGCGIAAAHLPKLTDPFFTTRREEGGTGLGLSVSAGIVQDHGGRLEFTSIVGHGTSVLLLLPAQGESS
ncbi:transporter substrate-binding domain-containing protein [Geopsychrobacter electrodiphilus]|uniref:transporter substrate-binding domain-containing protein n=1 Tax=Geopsychrobacter electrodiphilus TaxID=225196 RepID=UPI0003694D76|nr:transporter substrate-binding domain-containing protein [Geopsychrobacter electrodiphilus]